MDFLNWNIIKDDFHWAQDQWEQGNCSWLLVNCEVDFQGTIHKWVLHYDEYMYRKFCIQRNQMIKEDKVPLSILHQTEMEIQYWLHEMEDREQSEIDAGEDL